MEKFIQIIIAFIFAATALTILFLSIPRIDRYLDIKAIETCSNSSSFVKENSEEAFTAKYPIEDLYKNCLSSTK